MADDEIRSTVNSSEFRPSTRRRTEGVFEEVVGTSPVNYLAGKIKKAAAKKKDGTKTNSKQSDSTKTPSDK